MNEICQSLNETSSQLHVFLSNAYYDKSGESIEIMNVGHPDHEGFDKLAELSFSPDIA